MMDVNMYLKLRMQKYVERIQCEQCQNSSQPDSNVYNVKIARNHISLSVKLACNQILLIFLEQDSSRCVRNLALVVTWIGRSTSCFFSSGWGFTYVLTFPLGGFTTAFICFLWMDVFYTKIPFYFMDASIPTFLLIVFTS